MARPKPCPFCDGTVDPKGWLAQDDIRGPECERCGATAVDMQSWEMRHGLNTPPLGSDPRQLFEHYTTNPNLFRTLAQRLSEFAIYVKVSNQMTDVPVDEGIGPDLARASLLFTMLADVVEETKDA